MFLKAFLNGMVKVEFPDGSERAVSADDLSINDITIRQIYKTLYELYETVS